MSLIERRVRALLERVVDEHHVLAATEGRVALQLCEHATVTLAAGVQKGGGSAGLAFAFLLAAPATNVPRPGASRTSRFTLVGCSRSLICSL